MKQILEQKIASLVNEIQSLDNERKALAARDAEIEVRLHQVTGAIYELQGLIAGLDHQPSEKDLVKVLEPEE